ncbi:GNAT family N-acetyltransferase [Streptomyces sp. NPDC050560]|uniref:GNAT family N-acetyltransferase n=1 Tax=Streptomyces sp. NPDC050560 TaxID=3365630 RepID=UPI0037BBE751
MARTREGAGERGPEGHTPVEAGRGAREVGRGADGAPLDANPCAFLAHQGASPHVALRREPDCALLSADSDARPFNTVFAPALAPDGIEERVRELAGKHTAPGRAGHWWIGPSATPAGLPGLLAGLGFTPLPPIRLMTAVPVPAGAAPPGTGTRPVRSREELEDFAEVLRAAYGAPLATARFTHRVLASLPLGQDTPLQHFVVRAGGTPVAVASAFLHRGTCGLYNVATLPGARGRGYGGEAAARALGDAAERGARAAMLGAEPGAMGLYRRLGFVPGGTLARLVCPPPGP